MLVIFDLDDTLVTTSESISPIKMRDALALILRKHPLAVAFEEALQFLKEVDRTQESFRHTLAVFGERFGVPSSLLKEAEEEFYYNLPEDLPLTTTPGAHEVLQELKKQHELAIVTRGIEVQQKQKIEKVGIDPSLFSRIIVLESGNKGGKYQALMEELGYHPKDVIVCGDRIGVDLSPAKALGITTVNLRYGRGLAGLGRKEDVDYTIDTLLELLTILVAR